MSIFVHVGPNQIQISLSHDVLRVYFLQSEQLGSLTNRIALAMVRAGHGSGPILNGICSDGIARH